YVAEEFDREHGENPLLDLQSYQDLQSRALAAKIQLSSRRRTAIVHSYNGKSVKVELTREEFEEKTRHLVEKCKTICEIVMEEAKLSWSDLDKVLLVGGMTRMPMIRALISELAPIPVEDYVNPDEAVALGAAIQGVLLMLQEERESGDQVLPEETRQQFSSREGALMQVTNITSHTLGVVLWDDNQHQEYVFPMIGKMSPIPATARNFFGTADANMPRAIVRIVEGESSLPAECTALGVCDVELPPFLPKGSPVELVYEYNANQVLEVAVQAAGNQTKISIERNTGLAPHEIEQAKASLARVSVS
ncbi:MAG TPA: Hsp70 family protein, partial [Chthoniobacterales bacterium]|nr:Hsp70 family protein [Chthoniobacterales bacterium]